MSDPENDPEPLVDLDLTGHGEDADGDPTRDLTVDPDALDGVRAILSQWTDDLAYTGPTLSPPEVIKAWVTGLKAAGAQHVSTARLHKVDLPRVVEFDCPFFHDGEVVGTFASVRLLIDREGWFSHYKGLVVDGGQSPPKPDTTSCAECAHRQPQKFWEWLLTCPRCAAAESFETHPDHDRVEDEHDESPIAAVNTALGKEHKTLSGKSASTSTRSSSRAQWTPAASAAWLDEQADEDGQVIGPTLGQAAVWAIVKEVAGHPPQSMVREGQAIRKARAGAG